MQRHGALIELPRGTPRRVKLRFYDDPPLPSTPSIFLAACVARTYPPNAGRIHTARSSGNVRSPSVCVPTTTATTSTRVPTA